MTNDGIAALGYFYNLNDPTAALTRIFFLNELHHA
jgi:hypothetical protein